MDRPKGSGGDEGDPPPLPPIKKEINPTPTKGETTLTREPVKIEVTKKKDPIKSESEPSKTSTPAKIKREVSADAEDNSTASNGGRTKTDSSSTTSSHNGSVEDVQRAISEYVTMAQVRHHNVGRQGFRKGTTLF